MDQIKILFHALLLMLSRLKIGTVSDEHQILAFANAADDQRPAKKMVKENKEARW